MKRKLISQEEVTKAGYKVVILYFSDDSINVSLYDELDGLIESIEVYDAPEDEYDINLN